MTMSWSNFPKQLSLITPPIKAKRLKYEAISTVPKTFSVIVLISCGQNVVMEVTTLGWLRLKCLISRGTMGSVTNFWNFQLDCAASVSSIQYGNLCFVRSFLAPWFRGMPCSLTRAYYSLHWMSLAVGTGHLCSSCSLSKCWSSSVPWLFSVLVRCFKL